MRLTRPYLSESVSLHLFDTRPRVWTKRDGKHPGLLAKTRYEVTVYVLNDAHVVIGTFRHEPPGDWYLSAYPDGDMCWKGLTLDAGYTALQANPELLPMRAVDASEFPAPFPYDVARGVMV